MPKPIRYTPQEEQHFIEEYIANGFIATWAYKKVFPEVCETLSQGAIEKRAERLKNSLKDKIETRRHQIFEDLHIDAERVLTEIASIGFAVKGDETYTTQFKLKALDMLAKSMGLYDSKEEPKEQKIVLTLEE